MENELSILHLQDVTEKVSKVKHLFFTFLRQVNLSHISSAVVKENKTTKCFPFKEDQLPNHELH